MDVRDRIFEALKKQGKSAKELGDYIGVKSSSISAWRSGESYPSSKYIPKISEFLNLSPTFLFTGVGEESNKTTLTPGEEAVMMQLRGLSENQKFQLSGAISMLVAMQTCPFVSNNPERERDAVGLFTGSSSRD